MSPDIMDGPFGGRNGEAQNALRAAIKHAASDYGYEGEYADYEFLQKTPRMTLVVLVIYSLEELGYEIRPKEVPEPITEPDPWDGFQGG